MDGRGLWWEPGAPALTRFVQLLDYIPFRQNYDIHDKTFFWINPVWPSFINLQNIERYMKLMFRTALVVTM